MPGDIPGQYAWNGSALNQIMGPAIASATTIAPTHCIHHVTGTTAIVNITPPTTDWRGSIILLADAIWTWTAAGNIAKAGTVTSALWSVTFTYDGALWYPSRIA